MAQSSNAATHQGQSLLPEMVKVAQFLFGGIDRDSDAACQLVSLEQPYPLDVEPLAHGCNCLLLASGPSLAGDKPRKQPYESCDRSGRSVSQTQNHDGHHDDQDLEVVLRQFHLIASPSGNWEMKCVAYCLQTSCVAIPPLWQFAINSVCGGRSCVSWHQSPFM